MPKGTLKPETPWLLAGSSNASPIGLVAGSGTPGPRQGNLGSRAWTAGELLKKGGRLEGIRKWNLVPEGTLKQKCHVYFLAVCYELDGRLWNICPTEGECLEAGTGRPVRTQQGMN